MRKILSAALVICMLSTLLVLPVSAEEVVLDNFESATIGAVEMTPTGTADNKTITANIWAETGSNTYPEIVENKYGNLGKALMIKQPKFPKYGSNQANYTDSVFVNFPAAVNTEGKSASFNIYVPDLPGDNYLQMYLYEYGVGTYVGTRTHTLEPGWHQIGIYCNTDKQRICLDGTSFAEGGKTGDFQVRFRMYSDLSDLSDLTEVAAFVSEDMWYIIDDFMVADVATYSAYTTGMTAAGTSVSSADTAAVSAVISGLSVGTGVTAKAVKIDGAGNTTEVTTNIKDATHIVEKSQYSAIRLFPLALTGTIGNPGEDAEVHWAVGSGIVGELQPFIKVGKLVDAINAAENTSNTVKIVTSDGKTASRDMLVNDSMKVKFVSSAYAAEYSIVPRMAKYADSTGTAAGTAITFGSGTSMMPTISNVVTDGTVGTDLTATTTAVQDLNGYRFSYSKSDATTGLTTIRTQASSDQGITDDIMKNGAYSVVEMVIKPETLAWYTLEYRWYDESSETKKMTPTSSINAFKSDNVSKAPTITFAPNGKIYMGGSGTYKANTESVLATSGTYIADYEINNTYKVQIVFETPVTGKNSFEIKGIYINGEEKGSDISIYHGYDFEKLGEVDLFMWPKSGETAYTVSYAGIKAYSCDNFTVDAYLPTTISYPSTTYDNDAVVGGKTLKPNSLTTVSTLVGTTAADNGYCMWVTDADDNEVAGTATIADGMTLNAASLDGKAKGTSYKISFATDYGKLTKSENTYSRTVYNENGAMKMLVAVYDGAVLKDAYMSASPAESGLEKTLTVSARALTGSETAKAFLWDSLGSLKPYIGACEIANDGAITQVNATNY